ncbi:MAG: FAD-dependent oxidoreductase [Candidatus Marsarchaeota archaeon]|nr:FAD-dependent oxidoreductase [Candidatus Marsarchaeota archaeon]
MADSSSLVYDVLVIGAGCAGSSAAMYAGRFGLKVLMIGELPGGTITQTHVVENYPGFESITGLELGERLLHHAQAYGVELKMEKAMKIARQPDSLFAVTTDAKTTYLSRTIIAATGAEWKKLGAPGEKEYANRGVHYCALCDGAFYKNKVIAIVGSGDSAAKEAQLLAEYGSHVYMFVRGNELHGEPINNKRVAANRKITVFTGVQVKEIVGGGEKKKMTSLKLSKPCAPAGAKATDLFPADALFVLIGQAPLSVLLAETGVALNEKGEVKVDREMRTNVEGVYAAGDVNDSVFKQAIVSAADGVVAAYSAFHHIGEKKK